ncbi:MAG: cysteine--tRNA ligase, partial [Alphaproteobacteria bacterium]|nr:cysteine--tRNA ligase [Alphaproteobacteria bacterium]
MPLLIQNTLSRAKEPFTPLDPGHVRMYVCGPTVYDFAHIGNARPVVVFDVLYRLLKRQYSRVTYARNITDVDDKIIDASKSSGEPIERITARTTDAYHEDMDALGALRPDVEPRATAHVLEMVRMIKDLIARGHAYAADGHVLFNVPSMAEYGRLSRHNREELIAGARIDVAPYKRDPADFVLWKPSTPDLPGWDSPWGRGRPGWHIECSAMSQRHLGETFDIHGGGLDLIFPHHENEIAQSRCAHGTPFMARYWMHNGYLTVNGEKMSKSLGNFFTVRDLLAEVPGEALRYFLLSGHYRAPLDFTKQGLAEAKTALDRLYQALRAAPAGAASDSSDHGAEVVRALEDDLNTPLALAQLHELATIANKADSADRRGRAVAALRQAGLVLGLLQQNADAWFRWKPAGRSDLDDNEIDRR